MTRKRSKSDARTTQTRDGSARHRVLAKKADVARMIGSRPQTVTAACKSDGALYSATVGQRVDLSHPDAQRWLIDHNVDVSLVRLTTDPDSFFEGIEATGETIEDVANMCLIDLVRRHGSIGAFERTMQAVRTGIAVRREAHELDALERKVISTELVETHVFGAIDSLLRRLLTDTPKTIVRRADALSKSSTPIEEIEGVVRELIGAQIKPIKKRVARTLRDA